LRSRSVVLRRNLILWRLSRSGVSKAKRFVELSHTDIRFSPQSGDTSREFPDDLLGSSNSSLRKELESLAPKKDKAKKPLSNKPYASCSITPKQNH